MVQAQVQGSYTAGFTYSCTSFFAKNLIGVERNQTAAQLCPAPQDYEGGSALVAYNSTSFYDDLLWSSAWLWQLTGTVLPPPPPPPFGPPPSGLWVVVCSAV